MQPSGPLTGIRVVEVSGIGPGPFCAMMLADAGADVLRIERPGGPKPAPPFDAARNVGNRGRRSLILDVKDPRGRALLLRICEAVDVLIEGGRPGVMERLGLGPDICLARNPRLIYGRMTGWGQQGPLARMAGHDINYFGLSGSLAMCGRSGEVPSPNLNLVADMGGGGLMLAFGIVAALLEAVRSGKGQVIDAAMVDGAALLAAQIHGNRAMGRWSDARGTNLLDSGAPFYDVYETADGGYMAVGAIEPQFYALLIEGLGLADADLPGQRDQTSWPAMKARFAEIFRSRTRAEWTEQFEDSDACVTPVLTPDEAARHPHLAARDTFVRPGGVLQPAPAPRFGRTPGRVGLPPADDDAGGFDMLCEWGLTGEDLDWLRG